MTHIGDVLMDMVAHLQLEVEALKSVQAGPAKLTKKTLPVQSKPVAFTSTKVPKFGGATSWGQYRQVFDTIVRSNGWDDATVALQLLSHLEGDAMNVALLVPEAKRAMWTGLVGALTEHYGSPGRLADYLCQFERTTRREGEDPSKFAIALETLAVKAFGDKGPIADLGSYGTGSSPVLRTVLCDDILIVSHRKLPSRTSWTGVECGISLADTGAQRFK